MGDEQEINPDEILEAIQRRMGSSWRYEIDLTKYAGMNKEEIIASIIEEAVEGERAYDEFAKANPEIKRERNVRYPFEVFAAYKRWLKGDTQTEIHQFLEEAVWADGTGDRMFESVGLRTITRWLAAFRELPEDEVGQDKGLIWYHNLEEYGIPWDKYSDLIQSWGVELTPRRAKWMIRLQQIRHRGRPFTQKTLMTYTRDFAEEEQKYMLGLWHNLDGTSMKLQIHLMSNPR